MDELVQREHNYAIVDEVDSVLIDDARTPLIISGPVVGGDDRQEYIDLKPQVERIVAEQKAFLNKEFVEAKNSLPKEMKVTMITARVAEPNFSACSAAGRRCLR